MNVYREDISNLVVRIDCLHDIVKKQDKMIKDLNNVVKVNEVCTDKELRNLKLALETVKPMENLVHGQYQ